VVHDKGRVNADFSEMTDAELLATCIYSEAANQSDEGKAAIAQVVSNRMRRHYQSDGTIAGTVLHPGAYSAFMFDFVNGAYTRVIATHPVDTLQDRMLARAQTMEAHYARQAVWPECLTLAEGVVSGNPILFNPLLNDAVLYVNLDISHPVWANKARFLAKVGAHSFFADP
jgi:spore germination cell wall hydrolase CwlJ-like protein